MRWLHRLEVAVLVLGTVAGTLGCDDSTEIHTGGTCPTCTSTPSVITTACASETTRTLASGPSKGGGSGGSGGGPTTTTTTTTTGTPFAAPTNVTVNTPPSSSVSIVCGSGATAP
jgi:hypothetical protein